MRYKPLSVFGLFVVLLFASGFALVDGKTTHKAQTATPVHAVTARGNHGQRLSNKYTVQVFNGSDKKIFDQSITAVPGQDTPFANRVTKYLNFNNPNNNKKIAFRFSHSINGVLHAAQKNHNLIMLRIFSKRTESPKNVSDLLPPSFTQMSVCWGAQYIISLAPGHSTTIQGAMEGGTEHTVKIIRGE
ncbi:MAG: hypothetical protein M0Z50_10105 [Planctomycetia bacterium]|nr:hypothetical protein [Planctomycetia bacterium]